MLNTAKEVLSLEAKELTNKAANLTNEFENALNLIHKIKGKLIITGVGKSGLIGAKIAATFSSTGTASFFLHPTEAMHGDLGMISKDDCVLAISYSGESSELVQILPHIKRFNIPLIGMASSQNSTLGKYSDVFINIQVQKEACPFNAAPTSSTTLTLALGDALAVCLMKKRNFQKEDFASFHPGGSLGKKLFMKVKDIMLTENLPIVSQECSLKVAIDAMTSGKVGNVLLVDQNERLKAVLSDGDLRRALMDKGFSLENKAILYATKNPKTLENENILASEAIKIIEQNKIQMLVVLVDEKPKGILHIHELIKAGIK